MVSTGWNPDALSGTRLGSCILEEPLSLGGMGAVFLARQERPRRYVAVKIIHRHQALDPAAWSLFLARFQREADATAALDHANIVPIYEFGETGDIAYLVMPHLPDGSLAARLEREGPLALPVVLTAVEQVAAALDYAHARGIVHRDVKPSNMLLHPDGRILLADFGIARPLDLPDLTDTGSLATPARGGDSSLTQAGSSMGTPEFMAPEQVRGGPITPATDTYALGISTYELLGGQTPFGGGDVTAVLRRQMISPPRPLRALRPDVSPKVEEVVFWALAKDPADRPASSGDFARALRSATRKNTLIGGALWSRPGPSEPLGPRGPLSPNVSPGTGSNARYPEPTMALPRAALTGPPVGEPDGATDRPRSDDNMATLGPGGINTDYVLGYGAGGGGGAGVAPQWPDPQRAPNRRLAVYAITGLVTAIVAVIVLGALLANTIQSVLTSPSGQGTNLPAATGPQTATPLPSPTITPSPTAVTNWLVVVPTQIDLTCNKSKTVTITNEGPEAVSWTASSDSFFISVSPRSGSLRALQSTRLSVSIRSGIFAPANGTIIIAAGGDQQAGEPATVSYSTAGCNGG